MKKTVAIILFALFASLIQASLSLAVPTYYASCGYGYRVDGDQVLFCDGVEETAIPGADAASFKELEYYQFATDDNAVYCGGQKIDADPDTFTEITGAEGFYRDASSVFFGCEKIEGADPDSFENIGGDFNMDKDNIYYQGLLLEAEKATFEVIGGGYAKDADSVYFRYSTVPDADPSTFTIRANDDYNSYCDGDAVDAMDDNAYYMNGFKVCDRSGQKTFSDVNANTPYESSIMWMARNGVIDGYPDGTFGPDKCVNRAEMLKILFNILNVDTSSYTADLFSDTYASEWYAPFIVAGRARGTIIGYPDGTFAPDKCVNRVEAIKMAVLEFNDGKIPEQYGSFVMPRDVVKISAGSWWEPYFLYAMGANAVGLEHFSGYGADMSNPSAYDFGPADPMSRKEVVEMLYRMKALKDNGAEKFDDNMTPDAN